MGLKAAIALMLAVTLPMEASAQRRPEREERAGGWITSYWMNPTPQGRQRSCAFQNEGAGASWVFNVTYAQDLPANEQTQIGYLLINPAWQLPEGARGNVTLQVGANTRALPFVRISPTGMSTNLLRDPSLATFVAPLLEGGQIIVTLPNGERQTITGPRQDGTPNFVGQRLECMMGLLVTDPPPSTNPFGGAAPNPPPQSRDPFAPAR